ncbi:hypothetical protein SAMN02745163_00527 [Clostridium cavendishii DSM 21758]|uniref:Uncharacterized protein n=1 Tax=Clostridium cavendishii DSM 21758 TaxID=1121302 RepID=A0A1M6CR34_9CLOT|nr:hypothetical protein [Clostridium cavendishii]SHI63343.1 hypothetical protein SAMN02745163_00527 [Clostridium cavendishii DSM 21758]
MLTAKYILKTQVLSLMFAVFAEIFISIIICTRCLTNRNVTLVLIFLLPMVLLIVYTYVSYKKLDGYLRTSMLIIFPNFIYLILINKIIALIYLGSTHNFHHGTRFYLIAMLLILITWINVILGVFIGTNLKINKINKIDKINRNV